MADIIDLDGQRPMYGDNYEAAAQWTEEFAAEVSGELNDLQNAIALRNKTECLAIIGNLIDSLTHIREAINGVEPD